MKYLKSVWLESIVLFAIYFLLEYHERGFDSVLFASGIALAISGIRSSVQEINGFKVLPLGPDIDCCYL